MATMDKPGGLPRLMAAGKAAFGDRGLQARFGELLERVQQTRPGEDLAILQRAFDFAAEKHGSQMLNPTYRIR
jgi:hypothetical protein